MLKLENIKNWEDTINQVVNADCLDLMRLMPENCIDAIITDPPYGLVSINKRFSKKNSKVAKFGNDGSFQRLSKGFMGKEWDGSGIEYNVEMWGECLRILKPGGYLLAFTGTRTYHKIVSAIDDAGFEIRDMIAWVYGSGFPKNLNIGDQIAKREGAGTSGNTFPLNHFYQKYTQTENSRQWNGWGTSLKPALEPICVARKPVSEKTVAENVLKWKTGGVNIDESRIGLEKISVHNAPKGTFAGGEQERGSDTNNYKNHIGRWPANLIHDGSDEVVKLFPKTGNGDGEPYIYAGRGYNNKNSSMFNGDKPQAPSNFNDNGSAARFFYTAKTSKAERNRMLDEYKAIRHADREKDDGIGGDNPRNRTNNKKVNFHPTVKPVALMEYLIKLVTPPKGIILDPFAGSGSTLIAARQLDFNFIGIEKEVDYVKIARQRIKNVQVGLF